ncbi:MAG: alpha/beta fold hydrolase [Myxococcota bacterium]
MIDLFHALHAHFVTVTSPFALQAALSPAPGVPWSVRVPDPRFGEVTLRGRLSDTGSKTLFVLVHGLGGSSDSLYLVAAAHELGRMGLSCLRISMRGGELDGEDTYHAGISQDLHAALAHPSLAHFERIFLIGFSLGGHITLKAATEEDRDPRVAGVAAICAPLELSLSQRMLDRTRRTLYRAYILNALKAIWHAVDARGRASVPYANVQRIRSLRAWDEAVVVPRFGFAGADDYYDSMSVSRRLRKLDLPALYVGTLHDPVVRAESVQPALAQAKGCVEAHWSAEGGHVYMFHKLDLGLPTKDYLVPQVLRWLERNA